MITATLLTQNASTTDSLNYVTGSVSPVAGRILLVFVYMSGIGNTANNTTVSGLGSTTWVSHGEVKGFGATGADLSVHTGTGYSGSGPLTINNPDTATNCIWAVIEVNGADVSDPVVSGSVKTIAAGSVNTVNLGLDPAESADSRAFAAFACDNNTSGQATPRTNWTELSDRGIGTPASVMQTQWRSDAFETTASVTWVGGPYNSGGIALEIRAASTGQSVTLGTVVDSSAGLALTRQKTRSLTVVLSQDVVSALTRMKRRSVAVVSTAASVHELGERKTRTLGLAPATDGALSVGTVKRSTLGAVSDAESASPMGRTRTRTLPTVTATDVLASLGRTKQRTLSPTSESASGSSTVETKSRTLDVRVESGTVLSLVRSKVTTLAIASEVQSAHNVTRAKVRIVGSARDQTTVQTLASNVLGIVRELDSALSVSRIKSGLLSLANETSLGFSVDGNKQRIIDVANSASWVFGIAGLKQRGMTPAREIGGVNPFAGQRLTLGLVTEMGSVSVIGTHRNRTTLTDSWSLLPRSSMRRR